MDGDFPSAAWSGRAEGVTELVASLLALALFSGVDVVTSEVFGTGKLVPSVSPCWGSLSPELSPLSEDFAEASVRRRSKQRR